MHTTKSIALSLLTAALCAGLPSTSPAQGGWRQWDVRLRDGRQLEANPLGAPDDRNLSLSVAGYEGRELRIARTLVDVVAAQPLPGESLPAVPVALCEDAIVRRDGTTTIGRITLAHVRWSEGVVTQRGDSVDLRDVAYLVFAARGPASPNCRREATSNQPDLTQPVGSRQVPRPCAAPCGRSIPISRSPVCGRWTRFWPQRRRNDGST
jgi:hypothetical protein